MYKVHFPSAFHNNYFINPRTPPGFLIQDGRVIVVSLLLRKLSYNNSILQAEAD